MKKFFLIVLVFALFSSACSFGGQAGDQRPLLMGADKVINQSKADEAKQIIVSMEEVVEVTGINSEKSIYIAAKVKQFDRFFLDQIRSNAHNKVKKRFPEANVHISTDKKVFLELEKLEKQINEDNIEKEKLKEKIKKIEDFMKG